MIVYDITFNTPLDGEAETKSQVWHESSRGSLNKGSRMILELQSKRQTHLFYPFLTFHAPFSNQQ